MLRTAAHGVWEFVVGDDWRVALGVAVTLGAAAAMAAVGLASWWIAPIAIPAVLYRSVRREAVGSSA
jgi:hypothetical protein